MKWKAASALYNEETFGLEKEVVFHPAQLKDNHVLMLWGGEDISPALYHETACMAHADDVPSRRDLQEVALVTRAVELGIPILGICRGAQLLCALLGGRLWQHVDNHAGRSHPLIFEGKEYKTNSYHHQMMIPSDKMEVLGVSPCLSPQKFGEGPDPVISKGPEAEVVFVKEHKAAMIQGHPEWVEKSHDLYKITQQMIERITSCA